MHKALVRPRLTIFVDHEDLEVHILVVVQAAAGAEWVPQTKIDLQTLPYTE